MGWTKEYLLSVTAAAVLCSCISAFFKKGGPVTAQIRTICSIYICLVVIHPLLPFSLPDFSSYFDDLAIRSDRVVEDAVTAAFEEKCRVIKENAEAYICDKAASLGAQITAQVTISEQAPYAPEKILISGDISPYARSSISATIASDLGITKENQIWNGS